LISRSLNPEIFLKFFADMMSEINKQTSTPIINRIEDLIKRNSNISYSEVVQLMVNAESNPEFDVKKALENISAENKL